MKFTDAEIIAALEAEEAQAEDASTGELAKERADALDRYRGAPLGNEVEGRSQVVDKSVADTVEWIMPSLVRIYLGGDEIGKFEARSPEDEEAAQRETEVCNWYLEAKNDVFSQINATLRDALLLKNGYMVGQWVTKSDQMTEMYVGKTDEELALLMQDDEVEIVEHSSYPSPEAQQMLPEMQQMPPDQQQPLMPPPQLHDVKVRRKQSEEYVGVESLPPDEMLVSKRHRWTSLMDADFVEWVRRVSVGQLRAEGFDIPDDVPGDDEDTLESYARDRFASAFGDSAQDETPDPSRRIVTFRDAYIRMDMEGNGVPQLWRIARISGSKEVVLKEEADIIPFAAFSPILYPHSHVGTSIYDLISDLGVIKTVLLRQYLDGLYLQNSGRMAVDVNRVNLDDLLVSRPGGIVRVDGPLGDAMMPIITPDVGASVLGGLEFIEAQKEGRTGVTRYSSGLDANTLNKTATGVQAIQAAANQRIELIARTLAGGFKDLFLIIHALARKHAAKALQTKLGGKWVTVNPREWMRRTDFSISVGLGTGTPDQQLQKLIGLAQVFQQGMQMGLAGPTEAYNFGTEIWKAAGYRNPDRFIKAPQIDPQTGEPQQPPPQKDPLVQAEEVKAQATMQKAQIDGQMAMQKAQADGQMEMQKFQASQQVEGQKMQMQSQMKEREMAMQAALDEKKLEMEAQLKREEYQMKAELMRYEIDKKAEVDLMVAKMNANLAHERELQKAQVSDIENRQKKSESNNMAPVLDRMNSALETLSRPKVIIRGADGRAEGITHLDPGKRGK